MFFEELRKQRILPILTVKDLDQTRKDVANLKSRNFRIIEITLRTPQSIDAINEFCSDEDLIIGAGSISTVSQMENVIKAGAKFGVSPGFFPPLVKKAVDSNFPYIPGISTPSEIMGGVNLGVTVFKFFPSEPLGGLVTLRAMSAPFPGLSFIPTGGVNSEISDEYLKEKCVLAVGGSWLV
ncbi:MAG: bifunctional 4-hydroxy-2-oxoglutarate aldolase/2-dehydro-3-deoxy-phosphogluconate aldolase [Actinobacteria bacterium]|uniref:Unannotated protein n=1 Tax=freshwater metagenome TaxID=449393 RepID=A0A6J7W149_9ZZZZ|nr:bifunctional 4-hydroxy-2-oxoglutarate aldolase/2-dehydro-3-deoxy-phosphogluconate aldolase [Actinomycetota bacterium]MSX71442.1 bifunctional 4-hydroxy-2-oxoglutarate aldolase/2-dehydro-3-deoxy-phosphogluconate aldolase [Actinomycetota bacterium]MSY69306.1 bifunctional 4-hydroxy-2-oxoglutarate aldolase/2-dehydro-3-deoxy-phosphogluconate aldolase [Actinomycetota bacterium]MTA75309.1 bifunctional 4-hydroxy-2-oxoglutarate aldolase/2-dehydro-3-deoxy-phosphogluconate aldolase [Actinomycetota bacter